MGTSWNSVCNNVIEGADLQTCQMCKGKILPQVCISVQYFIYLWVRKDSLGRDSKKNNYVDWI